jgi:hypothetical protein
MVAFAGGRSKPRFNLIGVDVDPLNVARTNAGTTHSAAAVTRMANPRATGDPHRRSVQSCFADGANVIASVA